MSTLVIVGLGYVGLPLARAAAAAGLTTIGFDVSDRVVAGLNGGRSHVDDLSDAQITEMLGHGFSATTDASVIESADTVVVCVPTPLSDAGGPDLSMVESAMTTIGARLQPGTLVILESTTYPGTTEEVAQPLLEASGLRAGVDFHLAYSPERVDPGNETWGIENTPKVVGGLTPACGERASAFYGQFVATVVPAKGMREAEMAKLLENTYRHVNIALVNEMVRFSHELDIDFWDVISLAATKPFGFQSFRPGPGVGGHCIPIDPNYLSHRVQEKLGYPFRFVELAQEINSSMPSYVAHRVQQLLNEDSLAMNGATVLLLGVTYKPNIADQRETPAEPLAQALQQMGATVQYYDPFVPQWRVADTVPVADPTAAAREADITVLVQAHSSLDVATIAGAARRFLDLQGVTDGHDNPRL